VTREVHLKPSMRWALRAGIAVATVACAGALYLRLTFMALGMTE
jgi:hypothetical protein